MSSAVTEPKPTLRDWLENVPEPQRLTIARLYMRALELGQEEGIEEGSDAANVEPVDEEHPDDRTPEFLQ